MAHELDPFDHLDAVTARFATLARSLGVSDLDLEFNHGERTVVETVRHVCEQYRSTSGDSSTEHDDSLAVTIAEIEALGPSIRATFEPLVDELGTGVYGAPTFVLTEVTVHGHQIASEVPGASWEAQADEVMLLWRYGIGLFQGLLLPEASEMSETWELRFAGEDDIFFTIDSGQISGDRDVRGSTVHVLQIEDPVAFTLAFPMCRYPATDPKQALLASRFKPV